MAYALRYYKEIAHADGSVVRLEIHNKHGAASPQEIGGVVQGLSLQIQGQQGDIDTPIVKTSLSMTFVDADDLSDGRKNGFWEEFYTPDALLWKVILKGRKASETSFRTIWGGYVTPDSYSEDLVYRGSVNIIARDNIGHMQDFPFDALGDSDGMISLFDLLRLAWEKIESPMTLMASSDQMLRCEGVSAVDTLMNVSAFEGMSWYEAVEKALYSYGLVMRYVGGNEVRVGALRYLPNLGRDNVGGMRHVEPVFLTGATRELAPAARRIEESVEYDLEQKIQPGISVREFSGSTYDVDTSWGVVANIAWPLSQTSPGMSSGWYNEVPEKTLAFNPGAYEVDEYLSESDRENIRKSTCILTGSKDDDTHSLSYAMMVSPEDFAIDIAFGRTLSRLTHGYGDYFLGYPINEAAGPYLIRYAVKVTYDGKDYYLNPYGEWVDIFMTQTQEAQGDKMSVNIPLSGIFSGVVNVSLVLLNIDTGEEAVRIKPILSIALSNRSDKAYLEKNTVNTVYNNDNNVILSREPEIGPAYNATALPGFIRNGIFYRSGDSILPASSWGWSGGSQQMAVYNHLQLLAYYAKPNNLISGTIMHSDITDMQVIYEWHGAEHMLVAGNYNLLNGRIESAVLREFARYEDMWSDVPGSSLPETEAQGVTNYESGNAGSAGSQTYSNVTNVSVGSGGGASSEEIKQILEWFYQYDENTIGTRFNFVSEKQIASGGIGEESGESGGSGGSETGGSAALENNVSADTTVGFISKNTTLYKGLTFTDFVELMFSQGVKTYEPSVSIDNVPSRPYEVGSEITLNVSASFQDGYFAGTDEGTTSAGCQPGAAAFTLDGQTVAMPHVFVADTAKTHTVRVSQPYGASTVKPVKGGEELTDSIPGGTAEDSASFIVGYRAFWGYVTDAEAESMDSAAIRGLEHPDTIINPGQSTVTLLNGKYEIPGGQDIIIAVPSGYVLGEVKDEDGDFSKAFKALPSVEVKCAGDATKTYKVYRFDNGTPYSMEVLSITIKKA